MFSFFFLFCFLFDFELGNCFNETKKVKQNLIKEIKTTLEMKESFR